LLLRLMYNMVNSKEIRPTMPNATPNPMAAFDPVESLEYVLEGFRVAEEVDDAIVNCEVGAGLASDEVDTALSTFQPTTAMAPTEDFAVKVVVAVAHNRLSALAVDAYVRTIPGNTSDKQFPTA